MRDVQIECEEQLKVERERHKQLTKARQYLESVASYMKEQSPDTKITVIIGNAAFLLLADQMSDVLEEVDTDLSSLEFMSEIAISQMNEVVDEQDNMDIEEPVRLPKTYFLIADGKQYRASGNLINIAANALFEQMERVCEIK